MMYPYGGGPFGWGAAAGMGLFGLLVVVGIILLIVWAVRAGEHQHMHAGGPYYGQHRPMGGGPGMMPPQGGYQQQQPMRDPAVDAARERYARGEITKDQFDEIMRNLGYQTPPSANPPAAT